MILLVRKVLFTSDRNRYTSGIRFALIEAYYIYIYSYIGGRCTSVRTCAIEDWRQIFLSAHQWLVFEVFANQPVFCSFHIFAHHVDHISHSENFWPRIAHSFWVKFPVDHRCYLNRFESWSSFEPWDEQLRCSWMKCIRGAAVQQGRWGRAYTV